MLIKMLFICISGPLYIAIGLKEASEREGVKDFAKTALHKAFKQRAGQCVSVCVWGGPGGGQNISTTIS